MADIGLGAGFGAGGAVQGLQELLGQRLQAAALAETLRKNQADEALRQQQIDEQAKTRQMIQSGLQQDRTVNEAARIGSALSPGDSLLQNPGAQNPSVSPVVSMLMAGGQGSNIGVVPPLNAAPIPSGAQVPALPSGSGMGAPSGDVLRTGPSVTAPLTPPAPGAIGNVTWLGTPQERKTAEQEQTRRSYLRTLDPNSPFGQAAAYTEGTGHTPPAFTMRDPAAELQAKKDYAEFQAGLRKDYAGFAAGLRQDSTAQKPLVLSPQAKAAKAAIENAGPLTDQAMAMMREQFPGIETDPNKYNGIIDKASALYHAGKYYAGFGDPNDPRQQIVSLLQPIQAGQYMRSSRSREMLRLALAHMADMKQTPSAQYQRLKDLRSIMPEMEQGIIRAEQPVDPNNPLAGSYFDPASQASGGVIYARDPQGQLHQAPAGTALPAGWKPEKGPQ